jgi:hypothetical protein
MTEELESSIKNVLLNKELSAIEFYNINEKFWVFDEEKVWVIDCGVQLTLGEQQFCFAWSDEKQLYEHHIGKLEDLTGELPFHGLEAMEVESVKELIGKKISDVKIQWNFYHDLDENYEPTEHKNYMPMEMILHFDNGSILQLAAIEFTVDTEKKMISNATFDSTGNFLITLNHLMKIKEAEESLGDEELI